MAKGKYPSDRQDQFMLRLPEGMRDRIAKSAEENGRSMNAEIVQALEQFFPKEPTIDDVVERVHSAINMANSANRMPYRQVLVDALDALSERLSSGIEFKQFQSRTLPKHAVGFDDMMSRLDRWRRAKEYGVEQSDLERELARGLVQKFGGDTVNQAIAYFREKKPERALRLLGLDSVKFADPDAAHKAIEADLRAFYADNWGDPDQPWERDD